MARIITKELAEKIVKKLRAMKISSNSTPHDHYEVVEQDVVIATISIRRGSDKDLGHDFLPRALFINPNQAKRLGQCPWSRADYLSAMREKGLHAAEDEGPETETQGG